MPRIIRRLAATLAVAATLVMPGVGLAADVEQQVDINAASVAELATLPGIGESKAKAIVEYRAAEPFQSIEDLKKVKGIGEKTFEALRPSLTVGTSAGRR